MDTKEDFVFLTDDVADKFNPYQEGEYLVIQVHTKDILLRSLHRGFDYHAAKNFSDLIRLNNRGKHYYLRVIHLKKLYTVNWDGAPVKLAHQQDWKIHEDYYKRHHTENLDCRVETCVCSYPLFWSWEDYTHPNGDPDQLWRPMTCLIDDHGREVDNCPNCDKKLIASKVCTGCKYYNDNFLLACAVNPCGSVDNICPDYSM
jgi:hypothetical protein